MAKKELLSWLEFTENLRILEKRNLGGFMREEMRSTGFSSVCSEYGEDPLSLDEKIITHPSATFFIKAGGNSKSLQLNGGDLLIIDRSLNPAKDDMVLAEYQGRFIITKFYKQDNKIHLYPWKRILGEGEELKIEGVVKAIVREFRS